MRLPARTVSEYSASGRRSERPCRRPYHWREARPRATESGIESVHAISFTFTKPDPSNLARVGRLTTPHGVIDTPAFLVGAPQAAAQSLLPDEIGALGAQALVCQTYHLTLRPGSDVVADAGGLHQFMDWSGPLFTESGGRQVFSLPSVADRTSAMRVAPPAGERSPGRQRKRDAALAQARIVRVDDDGVTYRSYLDGTTHRLTPESSMLSQELLGADIIQTLAAHTTARVTDEQHERALARTLTWAERSLAARRRPDQALFGAVDGRISRRHRLAHVNALGALPFDGYTIGAGLDATARQIAQALARSVPALPEDRPRQVTGLGDPASLVRGVELGVDLFDADGPVRNARSGVLLTSAGSITITRAVFREDDGPVDPRCSCPTCRTFSRAYLRHLFKADELLAATLAVTHNLAFILGLMARLRASLTDGSFEDLRDKTLALYPARRAARQ